MVKRRLKLKQALGGALFVLLGVLVGFFGIWAIILGYSPENTHAPLAREAAQFFNAQFPELALTDSEISWLIIGSIEEDKGYQRAVPSGRWFQHFYDPVYNQGLWGKFQSSKSWAHSSVAQSAGIGGSHTWEDALYNFQRGNKKQALVDLGHILHLIQDATVPAHTRDDAHPGHQILQKTGLESGSPYESWTAEIVKGQELEIAENLIAEDQAVPEFKSLDEIFDATAQYSNNNFFSEDTTPEKTTKYDVPKVEKYALISGGKDSFLIFGVGKDLDGNEIRLFWSPKERVATTDHILVLDNYWSLLSNKAVINGAATIALFFEKAEQKQIETQPARVYTAFVRAFNKVKNWLGSLPIAERIPRIGKFLGGPAALVNLSPPEKFEPKRPDEPKAVSLEIVQPPTQPAAPARPEAPDSGSKKARLAQLEILLNQAAQKLQDLQNFSNQIGSSETLREIRSPSGEGKPGTAFFEPKGGSNQPAIASPQLTANNQQQSEQQQGEQEQEEQQQGEQGGQNESGQGEQNESQPEQNENQPEQNESNDSPYKGLVVINEIAWMGTKASPADEWLELYNASSTEISLAGWSLEASENGPAITFDSGDKIAGNGFFLLERTVDTTVASVIADKLYSGALNDEGEDLTLKDAQGLEVDKVPQGNPWLAGSKDQRRTMERINPAQSGEDPGNWQTFSGDGFDSSCVPLAQGADSRVILGTPKSANSAPGFSPPDLGPTTLTAGTSLIGANYWCSRRSPYYLEFNPAGDYVRLAKGASLIIFGATEVILKNSTSTSLFTGPAAQTRKNFEIKGSLKVLGESNPGPVTFKYPGSLSWDKDANGRLNMLDIASGSSAQIENAVFDGALNNSSSTDIVTLIDLNATSTAITASTFKNSERALEIKGSAVGGLVADSIFTGNKYPVWIESAFTQFSGNSGFQNELNGIFYPNRKTSGVVNFIENDLTWHKNNDFPYILEVNSQDLTKLASGVTLTIEPGAAVLASGGLDPALEALSGSIIDAQGTPDEPIIFSVLGDNPGAGDWQGIRLNDAAGIFKNVVFQFGGKNGEPILEAVGGSQVSLEDSRFEAGAGSAVQIEDSSLILKNSAVRDQAMKGLIVNNSGSEAVVIDNAVFSGIGSEAVLISAGANISIENSSFTGPGPGTGKGVWLAGADSRALVQGNTFSQHWYPILSDNPYIDARDNSAFENSFNAIGIGGSLAPGDTVSWRASLPYFASPITINASSTLELLAGAVVKPSNSVFPAFKVLSGGTLDLNGATSSPVTITSWKDDSAGGDANNDGPASSPAAGDWQQVLYEAGASGTITNAVFNYGGRGGAPALKIEPGANVIINNASFSDNLGADCEGPPGVCPPP